MKEKAKQRAELLYHCLYRELIKKNPNMSDSEIHELVITLGQISIDNIAGNPHLYHIASRNFNGLMNDYFVNIKPRLERYGTEPLTDNIMDRVIRYRYMGKDITLNSNITEYIVEYGHAKGDSYVFVEGIFQVEYITKVGDMYYVDFHDPTINETYECVPVTYVSLVN